MHSILTIAAVLAWFQGSRCLCRVGEAHDRAQFWVLTMIGLAILAGSVP